MYNKLKQKNLRMEDHLTIFIKDYNQKWIPISNIMTKSILSYERDQTACG